MRAHYVCAGHAGSFVDTADGGSVGKAATAERPECRGKAGRDEVPVTKAESCFSLQSQMASPIFFGPLKDAFGLLLNVNGSKMVAEAGIARIPQRQVL